MRKAFIYLTLVLVAAVMPSCGGKEGKDASPIRSFLQPLQEGCISDKILPSAFAGEGFCSYCRSAAVWI